MFSSLKRIRFRGKRNKNFLLVNDTRTQNNWGCHSTTEHIENFFCSKYKKKYSLDLNTLHDEEKTVFEIDQYSLSDLDFMVINGEGSIYDLMPKGLNILKAVHFLKKRKDDLKVLFINSTFDLSCEGMAKGIREVSPLVDLFGPREEISEANLRNNGIKNITLQPDFLYQMMDLETRSSGDYIVIGGNSNYYRPDRPSYDAREAYDSIINALLKNKEKLILYSSDMADTQFLGPLAEKYGLQHISCADTGWKRAFFLLSQAKLSISGRYHPSIMSLCGMTPCYFVSANNCKMEGTHNFVYEDHKNFTHSHCLGEEKEKIVAWACDTSRHYDRETAHVRDRMARVQSKLELSKRKFLDCVEHGA